MLLDLSIMTYVSLILVFHMLTNTRNIGPAHPFLKQDQFLKQVKCDRICVTNLEANDRYQMYLNNASSKFDYGFGYELYMGPVTCISTTAISRGKAIYF